MDVTLFVQIEYENRIFYIANGAVTKDHVYYPYLYAVPNLGVGGEGFSKVTTGQLSIIRLDDDNFHPFSQSRYYSLIEKAQQIPFRLYFSVYESPIFTGNLTLDEVTEDELKFLVVEEEFEKSLVYPVLDRDNAKKILNFYLYQPTGSTEFQLMFASEAFNLADQAEIITERTYSFESERTRLDPFLKLDYESSRDNRYLIASGQALMKRVMLVDPDDQSRVITADDLLNYVREGKNYYTTLQELFEGNASLSLNGMGFTIQTNSDGTIDILDAEVTADYKYYSEGGTLLYSYSDLMGIIEGQSATGRIWKVPNLPDNDYYLGNPVINPFTFGDVTMRDPVVVFGDRKLKRDFQNYNAGDPDLEFKPDSISGNVYSRDNTELIAYAAGQEEILATPERTEVRHQMVNTLSMSATTIQVYDQQTNQWVNISGLGQTVVFNQIVFYFSNNLSGPWYGNYVGNRPSTSDYSVIAKGGSGLTKVAGYSQPQNINQNSVSGYAYRWEKDPDTAGWGGDEYTWMSTVWHLERSPYTGVYTHYFYYGGVLLQSSNSASNSTHIYSGGNQYKRGSHRSRLQIVESTAPWTGDASGWYWQEDFYYDGPSVGTKNIKVHFAGSLVHNMWNNNIDHGGISWDDQYHGTDKDVWWADGNWAPFDGNGTGSHNGAQYDKVGRGSFVEYFMTPEYSKITRMYRLRISWYNVGDVYYVQKFSTQTVNTGSMVLWYNGSMISSWGGRTRPSTDSQTYDHARFESNISYNYTKGANMSVGGDIETFYANRSYTTPGGWYHSNTGSDALAFFNSVSGYSSSFVASGTSITVQTSNNHIVSPSDGFSPSLSVHRYEYQSNTITIPATEGQDYIGETNAYYMDDIREKIYKRSLTGIGNEGFPVGETDFALGAGWATERSFSGDQGYYLSQIFIENSIVYESENKTKLSTGSSTQYTSNKKNIPQLLSFDSIDKSDSVPADAQSDFFRLYRSDNKAELRDIAILRLRPNGSKPKLENHVGSTYTGSDGATYYNDTMDLTNLDLTYDSDPSVCYISLECYAGTVVEEMIFYDENDGLLDGASLGFPDGTTSTALATISEYGLPRETQKIQLRVRNIEDKIDDYAKEFRGFDAFIYQRIFPIMNASSAVESSHAVAACFEFYDRRGRTTFAKALDFNDMFNSSSGGGVDAFPEATDELAVHSIRNPHLRRGMLPDGSFTPRVFDDGVELGVASDLHGQLTKVYRDLSDDDFIHLSVDPFGQVAVSGRSIYGTTVKEFFAYVAQQIGIEKVVDTTKLFQNTFNNEIDVEMAAESENMFLPIYQSSEITVMEMADKVAKATNHQFFFRYGLNSSLQVTRTLVLIDLNYVFNNREPDKTIRNFEIVSMNTDFPFPIKAFEATLTRNVSYTGLLSQNSQSVMKSVSSNYRVSGTGVGNVKNFEVFSENFENGRFWLNRIAFTDVLPITSIEYNGIDMEIQIGSKVSFSDEFRKVNGNLIVQEVAYNFENESTVVKGISAFTEIVYT